MFGIDTREILAIATRMTVMASDFEDDNQYQLAAAGKLVQSEAKSAIGTYRYGWPPLSPSTIARKGKDTPLLQTGELRNSIEWQLSSKHSVDVGSNNPKAKWHELGTKTIPPRSFLVMAAQTRKKDVEELFTGSMLAKLGLR